MEYAPTQSSKQEPEKKEKTKLTAVKTILKPEEIIKKAKDLLGTDDKDPVLRASAIHTIAADLHPLDMALRNILTESICIEHNIGKSTLSKIIKDIDNESKSRVYGSEGLPSHVKLRDFEKFGFYENDNCYYFRGAQGIHQLSNFVMRPLFHIVSTINAKRLFEIENEYGYSEILEMNMDEMTSISRFRKHVESKGNYIFEGGDAQFLKLKRFWYENTKTCNEIDKLGWQVEGFFAWANGIFNGTWTPVDRYGMVEHEDRNYYIPAYSEIYMHDKTLFMNERKAKHKESNATLLQMFYHVKKVYGDNGIIAMIYTISSMFRDIITNITSNFPILNHFGPKGSGKTELARSLLRLFGRNTILPNINNTTLPGLSDHIASQSNTLLGIDEYKNNLDFQKVEFLKGLYDSVGRTRMNMDKDKKKETTSVNTGIVLCGQEMPTADIALFSRLIFLRFHKSEYTNEEKANFDMLKDFEKQGLTQITNSILSFRSIMEENYHMSYDKVSRDFSMAIDRTDLGSVKIEDRLFRNYVMILSTYHCLENSLKINLPYTELLNIMLSNLIEQNKETRRSNELGVFWDMVAYLVKEGMIEADIDYRIERVDQLKTDRTNHEWGKEKAVLLLDHTRIFMLYRKQGSLSKQDILPLNTLKYYLQNSKPFLGIKKAVRFEVKDAVLELDGRKNYHVTTAMAFEYNLLDIDIDYVPMKENDSSVIENDSKQIAGNRQKDIEF